MPCREIAWIFVIGFLGLISVPVLIGLLLGKIKDDHTYGSFYSRPSLRETPTEQFWHGVFASAIFIGPPLLLVGFWTGVCD